jgi:hypothetical protein
LIYKKLDLDLALFYFDCSINSVIKLFFRTSFGVEAQELDRKLALLNTDVIKAGKNKKGPTTISANYSLYENIDEYYELSWEDIKLVFVRYYYFFNFLRDFFFKYIYFLNYNFLFYVFKNLRFSLFKHFTYNNFKYRYAFVFFSFLKYNK